MLWLVAGAALGWAAWHLFGHTPYRIDIDVYQMGGQAWLDGRPLYRGDVKFPTPIGLALPFTYPPLAAIMFSPFAWLHMPAASVAVTLITLVLLIVSTAIVLTGLDVWGTSRMVPGPAWLRRLWFAVIIVAPATVWLEPIISNFAFGQINVVLMTLVIADCMPRRTPWPRGLLLGLGIALKLTPAVFLLYFLLRRDKRAALTALASFAAATLVGFILAWSDSWEYWTHTVLHTDRIGTASLNTDQNIVGALARLGLGEHAALPAVGGRVSARAGGDGMGDAAGAAGRRTRACGHLRCFVRFGGFAGVVVTPLGVDAAGSAGDGDIGLATAQPRAGRSQRRRGRVDEVDADRTASRAPRGDRGLVASTRRNVLRVVGAGGHRHGWTHCHIARDFARFDNARAALRCRPPLDRRFATVG